MKTLVVLFFISIVSISCNEDLKKVKKELEDVKRDCAAFKEQVTKAEKELQDLKEKIVALQAKKTELQKIQKIYESLKTYHTEDKKLTEVFNAKQAQLNTEISSLESELVQQMTLVHKIMQECIALISKYMHDDAKIWKLVDLICKEYRNYPGFDEAILRENVKYYKIEVQQMVQATGSIDEALTRKILLRGNAYPYLVSNPENLDELLRFLQSLRINSEQLLLAIENESKSL